MITARILWRATPAWAKWTALALAIAAGLFLAGAAWERQGADLDDARDNLEARDDAQDAIDDVRRDGAAEWLRETFGGAR